jgi:hypothetical protein
MDLNYWLKLSADRILLDSMVLDFAEKNPSVIDLTPEGLLALSKEIINRKDYWDNPRYHSVKISKQKPGQKDYEFIKQQIDEINADKIKGDDIKAAVKPKFLKAAEEAGEKIRTKVIEIINDPDLGAQVAVDFMLAFEKYLIRYPKDQLQRKALEIKAKLDKEKREYLEESNRLKDKLSGFSGLAVKFKSLFGGQLKEERDALLKESKEAVDMEYEMFCFNCIKDLFIQMLNGQAQEIRKKLEVFNNRLLKISKDGNLERAYERCLEQIKPYSKVQRFIRTYIFEDKDIEPFYKYLLGDLTNNDIEGDFLIKLNLKNNWDKYTDYETNTLEEDIVKYCSGIIDRRLFGGIEDFIHWKDSEKKGFKKSLVESLMNQATPLVTLNDRGNNQPQRMNIVTLGIADENSQLAQEIKDSLRKGDIGVSIAPTRNPYEISLLQTLHGIAPYNLSSIAQWQTLYRKNNTKINCHAILSNDAYPILWASYSLIPAKKLEEHYMVYLLLRYELMADEKLGKHGIEFNSELVQFELWYQQEKPQPMGRTLLDLFDYLKNNTMGLYLIRTVYNEYWKSLPFPQQCEFVRRYLPFIAAKVKRIEEAIEQEIKKNHEVKASSDELLSIKRGILKILQDYNDQFNTILSQRQTTTLA